MPTTSKTYDADDNLVTYTEDVQQITVSWEDSRTEYGAGVKASIHMRVPLLPTEDVDAKTSATFDAAKKLVNKALGGAAIPNGKTITSRAASLSSGGAPKRASASVGGRPTPERIAEAWADLDANPDGWFDNRNDKRNPKAPDYKGKDKNKAFAGFGLWLDSRTDDEPF